MSGFMKMFGTSPNSNTSYFRENMPVTGKIDSPRSSRRNSVEELDYFGFEFNNGREFERATGQKVPVANQPLKTKPSLASKLSAAASSKAKSKKSRNVTLRRIRKRKIQILVRKSIKKTSNYFEMIERLKHYFLNFIEK